MLNYRSAVRFVAARRWWPHAVLFAAALFAISGYGSGHIVGDSYSELHVDPIGFFARMRYAWYTQIYLGTQTGWMHGYEGPYGWSYALLQYLKVGPALAQRIVIFFVEWTIAVSMYWGLGALDPALGRPARVCGALAYLFNIYVAFNLGNGYSSFLMPYAMTPAALGTAALVLRGARSAVAGACSIAIFVVVAGGVNPPLLVILAIVVTLYMAIDIAVGSERGLRLRRAASLGALSLPAALALNAYWVGPFLDYGRTFWAGSQLDESPIMHNVDTSYRNVLRGFGQWGIFRGDDTGLWFPWSAWFASGFFYAFSWLMPIVTFGGLLLRRARSPLATYCVVLAAVAVPIVVGYHAEDRGPSITTPLYDFFYSHAPGFQMFRSAYKWVWPVEFAECSLFAIAISSLLRSAAAAMPNFGRRAFALRTAAGMLALIPVVSFIPILMEGENHSVPGVPAWYGSANRTVASAPQQRVAVFPSQYVPQYDWADISFYIENSYLQNDLVAGYISGAPNEGSHFWLTRAFRAAREGDPSARDAFRMLGADTVLARDDFRSQSDFSYVGDDVHTDTTQMHDVVSSVLKAHPAAHDGALRSYTMAGALPDVYLAGSVALSPLPAVAVASSYDPASLAGGHAVMSADDMKPDDLAAAIAEGLHVPADSKSLDGLAATLELSHGAIVTTVQEQNAFKLPANGTYDVFALGLPWVPKTLAESWYLLPEQIGANYLDPLRLSFDQRPIASLPNLSPAWTGVARLQLGGGWHSLHLNRLSLRPFALIAIVPDERWRRERDMLARFASQPAFAAPSTGRMSGGREALYLPRRSKLALTATPSIVSSPGGSGPSLAAETIDADFNSMQALRPGDYEVPYVPQAGTISTSFRLMPKSWYLSEETYDWNRGAGSTWRLLTRDAHFAVFSPAARVANAHARLRLALAGDSTFFDVYVNGRKQASFEAVATGPIAYDHLLQRGPLGVRFPRIARFDVSLRPGYNDVELKAPAGRTARSGDVDPDEGGSTPVVAAVAWDMGFTMHLDGTKAARVSRVRADRLAPMRIPIEGLTLDRDPHVAGTTEFAAPAAKAWLAELVSVAGAAAPCYRILPISVSGGLNNSLAGPLPNSFSDASARVLRAWIVLGSASGAELQRSVRASVQDLHLEYDRSTATVRSLPIERAKLAITVLPKGRASITHAGNVVSLSFPADRDVIAALSLEVPTQAFDSISMTVKANALIPTVRMDVRRNGSWLPAGDGATIAAEPLGTHRGRRLYAFALPLAIRPTVSELLNGKFVLTGGPAREEFTCSHGTPKVTDAPDSMSDCQVISQESDRVAAFSAELPGPNFTTLRAVRVLYAKPAGPNASVLSVPRSAIGGSREIRYVASGTGFLGAPRANLVWSMPLLERSVDTPRALPLTVDGSPFTSGVLSAGKHVVASADRAGDIGDLRVTTGQPQRVWTAVKSRRSSPVSLHVTVPANRELAVLVLNESYHPEWSATVDGAPLRHVWLNGFANGWLISKHDKALSVDLEFVGQRIYDTSLVITLLSTFVIVATLLYDARRSRRSAS